MTLSERGIIIRKTSESDLRQIYLTGIAEPVFAELPLAFSAENLAEIYSSDNSVCCTAVQRKKVLGFIIGSVQGDSSEIHWFMVKEKLRKNGIGSELLNQFLYHSKKHGASHFSTAVLKNSSDAVRFFRGREFTEEEGFVELRRKI